MLAIPRSSISVCSTRRKFLRTAISIAAGASAELCVRSARAARPKLDTPLIIDCHAHLYSEDDLKYPPIANPYRPPAGHGTLAHLRREMKAAGVQRATAIQTSTYYQWDNRLIADASRDNRDLLAGVCTLDPDDSNSPGRLERLVHAFNVRGLRSVPAKNGRLDDLGVDALWTAAEQLGIVVNAHVTHEKRSELETLLGRHPRVRVVLDHCLYLNAGAGPQRQAILSELAKLARIPTVYAKLSCVVSGSHESFPFRDMHQPCREVIRLFGPDRCVWGSDFPCQLWCPKATYTQHLRVFTHELGLDADSQRQILGETARRLWFT